MADNSLRCKNCYHYEACKELDDDIDYEDYAEDCTLYIDRKRVVVLDEKRNE